MKNWKRIIANIKESGFSDVAIAEKIRKTGVQVTQPTITRLRNGTVSDPYHELGEAILLLHEECVSQDSAA